LTVPRNKALTGEPRSHRIEEACVVLVLEPERQIIGTAHDDHVAPGFPPSAAIRPEIEAVEVLDVGVKNPVHAPTSGRHRQDFQRIKWFSTVTPSSVDAHQVREGFLRLRDILAPHGPLPISKSTWWAGVKSGRYPQPVKLGPRITAWRLADIMMLCREPQKVSVAPGGGQRRVEAHQPKSVSEVQSLSNENNHAQTATNRSWKIERKGIRNA
jgi:prophage regulatory protein